MQTRSEQFFTQVNSIVTLCGLAALVVVHQGCKDAYEGSDTSTAAAKAAVVSDVLGSVGSSVVLPTLDRFSSELDLLEDAILDYQSALQTGNSEQELTAAREQWRSTMSVWQELEVMQLGPAGDSMKFVGGESIRDEIYSWPTVNPCRVDQNTAAENWDSSSYYEDNLVNAYGLDAIEHLLFGSYDTDCPPQVNPVADGSWAALGEEGIAQNRSEFALVLLDNIQSNTELLIQGWSPDGGNFSELLLGLEGSPYESEQLALNAVYNSLFYVETSTKDRKLALPLGYRDCSEDTCPEDFEGLLSQTTASSLIGNLKGFKMLFQGGDGIGMSDLLTDLGHEDLSKQVVLDVEESIRLLEMLEQDMTEQGTDVPSVLADQPERLEEIYVQLQLVTTAIKQDIATVLSMEIPREAAGDND
ncbi:MAG: hypothetical protein CMK59_14895 [Proteobacteria bacterium]|nr:hypothetical protein [Pseudomonadota bacterium]